MVGPTAICDQSYRCIRTFYGNLCVSYSHGIAADQYCKLYNPVGNFHQYRFINDGFFEDNYGVLWNGIRDCSDLGIEVVSQLNSPGWDTDGYIG